jgi:hypothetical protein
MITIGDRDRFLILTPLFKVPFLPERSLARWWPDNDAGRENMSRRLNQLCREGLLVRHRAMAHIADVALFYHWTPAMPAPEFGALAWELAKRWEQIEPKPATFYSASTRAAKHYGGVIKNPLKSPAQISHDLCLGDLFVKLAHLSPLLASAWVPESLIANSRGYGEKVFDAYIVDSTSTPALGIDVAGASYAASNGARLRELHEDSAARGRGIPYEIWTVTVGGAK